MPKNCKDVFDKYKQRQGPKKPAAFTLSWSNGLLAKLNVSLRWAATNDIPCPYEGHASLAYAASPLRWQACQADDQAEGQDTTRTIPDRNWVASTSSAEGWFSVASFSTIPSARHSTSGSSASERKALGKCGMKLLDARLNAPESPAGHRGIKKRMAPSGLQVARSGDAPTDRKVPEDLPSPAFNMLGLFAALQCCKKLLMKWI